MKINSINSFNYNNFSHKNINNAVSNKDGDRANNIKNELNDLEVLGRSQVKFTGADNNEADEFDKTFYNEISKELELSKQDSHKFKKVVNQFLKNNNYDSLEEFCLSCDTDEKFYSFIENVASRFDLSDEKIGLLDKSLLDKIMMVKLSKTLEEDNSLAYAMMPIVVESLKKNVVCNNLLEKFNLDSQEKENISSHLSKLETNISPEQVAYEITDDYNLTSIDDYNYVLKTIKSRDKLLMDFIAEEETSEND